MTSPREHYASGIYWPARTATIPRRSLSPVAIAFGLAFAGTFVVSLLQGAKPFYGDSFHFWQLGESGFTIGGHFSILNFSDSWRGYALPLVDHVLHVLTESLDWTSSFVVKLFNALVFALIGTVLAPAFVKTVWPEQPSWGLVRRLVLTAILVAFWSGFLDFPLSDFPGLAMVLIALIAITRPDSPGWMLTAGITLAVSVNVRNAYLPFVAVVFVLVAWQWFEQRGSEHASTGRRVLCMSLLLLGFAVVSLPQSLSAHRFYHTWSFVPGASVLEPSGMYFTIGLPVQSYDVYVGHDEPGVPMNYVYPAGLRLLDEQPGARITSTNQFLGLFVSHPLVMGGMVVGHVINGLDPLYSTTYIENLHSGWQLVRRIGGFLLVFIALLRVLWPAARRRLGRSRLRYLVALSVCSLTTIPTQMERRYMLPVYLIAYVLALMPNWPNPLGSAADGARRYLTPVALAVAFAAFTAIVWYTTGDAISHLRFGPY